MRQALDREENELDEELEEFVQQQDGQASTSRVGEKRKRLDREVESPGTDGGSRAANCKGDEGSNKQQYSNRKRAKRRQQRYEERGHADGYTNAVATASPTATGLESESLPMANGAYVGTDLKPYGRTVARPPEYFAKEGFQYVQWHGEVAKPLVDGQNRLISVGVKKLKNPKYEEDIKAAFELIEQARTDTTFDAKEKKHKRGEFPALAYGISYGKGQPRPMRLGGEHQAMMHDLLDRPCFRNIAAVQSAYAAWSPKNYQYYFERNKELYEKLPDLQPNFPRSVFACTTVNFGPQTRTYIHTDSKNTAHGMCAVTSGGSYDSTKGGHIILWDLKIIMEFPPGCTILLPSVLVCHSNTPVQKGETRYSITQYTAGGIWRWLDAGGQTAKELKAKGVKEKAESASDKAKRAGNKAKRAEEAKRREEERKERSAWALGMFSTWDELSRNARLGK